MLLYSVEKKRKEMIIIAKNSEPIPHMRSIIINIFLQETKYSAGNRRQGVMVLPY